MLKTSRHLRELVSPYRGKIVQSHQTSEMQRCIYIDFISKG